jgi:hypothetical protein
LAREIPAGYEIAGLQPDSAISGALCAFIEQAGIRYRRHIENKDAMNITISTVAAVSAALILAPGAHADPGAVCQDNQDACAPDVPGCLQALANDGISGNSNAMVKVGYGICREISRGIPAVQAAANLRSANPTLSLQQGNFAVDATQVYLCPQVMRADGSTSLPMQ